jgi:hypothetical protein
MILCRSSYINTSNCQAIGSENKLSGFIYTQLNVLSSRRLRNE